MVAKARFAVLRNSGVVKALASIEVDLGEVEVGQSITVMWRGKPVFIRRRTENEIETARNDDNANLIDPQSDL